MAETYVVAVQGLAALRSVEEIPSDILKAARLAVNATTRRALAVSGKEIRRQVAFPARYLSANSGRLSITRFASDDDLEGRVRGRDRPTSLARFAVSGSRPGGARGGGVSVEVKPGLARRLNGAFLMRLRSGADGELGNVGLAVRTKQGKKPDRAYKPVQLGNGLWLLYGPSVDQVFDKTRGMLAPDLELFMEREFNRLLEVDLR